MDDDRTKPAVDTSGVQTLEEMAVETDDIYTRRALDTQGVPTNDGNYIISPLAAVRLYTHDNRIIGLIKDSYKRLLDIYNNKKLITELTGASRGTTYRYLAELGLDGYLGRHYRNKLAPNQAT